MAGASHWPLGAALIVLVAIHAETPLAILVCVLAGCGTDGSPCGSSAAASAQNLAATPASDCGSRSVNFINPACARYEPGTPAQASGLYVATACMVARGPVLSSNPTRVPGVSIAQSAGTS